MTGRLWELPGRGNVYSLEKPDPRQASAPCPVKKDLVEAVEVPNVTVSCLCPEAALVKLEGADETSMSCKLEPATPVQDERFDAATQE